MEFSHVEDGMVYMKGTKKNKDDIVKLMAGIYREYKEHTIIYTDFDQQEVENIKIDVVDDMLLIPENDLYIIFGVFRGLLSVSHYGESLGVPDQQFFKIFYSFKAANDYLFER